MNKSSIRTWAKEQRKRLDLLALSKLLVAKLQETEEYKQAKNIMLFYPMAHEINLLDVLNDKSKNFYLPKINEGNLLCCPYKKGDELCVSCFNTKEPLTSPVEKSLIDLVVVPALAVDKNNYRLGYGGGFYDRFLEVSNIFKIVCIPRELCLDSVYPEEHDVRIDKIIMA